MGIKIPKFSMPKGGGNGGGNGGGTLANQSTGESAKKIKANEPFNRVFTGVKNAGKQVKQAYNGEVPLTTAFRGGPAIQKMRESGKGADYEWGENTLSWKKIGAAGAGAYVGGDAAYRTLSGGSAYRNNDGQRDIVGIPII